MPVNRLVLALLLGTCLLLTGCGVDDASQTAADVRERTESLRREAAQVRDRAKRLTREARDARDRAKQASKRVQRRVRRVLDDLRKAVPTASRPLPESRDPAETDKVGRYLTEVVNNIDGYWTTTLTNAGLPEPRVGFETVARGQRIGTDCGAVADDKAAFYCTGDDTIYIAEQLASDLWEGISDDFPGQQAGYGKAVGDFGLAYVVAHEYAHNVQNELGFYKLRPSGGLMVFELQADCMAGLWGNSVYRAGKIKPGDVEEAMSTALAAGDFDYANENHHGRPQERRDAWLLGFETGEPARCQEMVA